MIKDILRMGGCKTEAEFYAKYPTEESFLEAFPQARPMMEQFSQGGDLEAFPQARPMLAKGGGLDIEAFPGAAPNINDYGGKTLIPPYIFQYGGMMQDQGMAAQQQGGQEEDPLVSIVAMVSQQYNIDPKEVIGVIQGLPKDMVDQLYILASNDPNQAAQRVVDMVSKKKMDPVKMMAKKGGSFDTPPTADQFYQQYPDVNLPIAMAQIGGSTPMLNVQSEIPTGGAFDEYGGSVFNYGQFPAIMKEGGTTPMNTHGTYVPDRLKGFLDKIHGYANKYMAEQGVLPVQQEQPMMPMAQVGINYFQRDMAKMPGSSLFDMDLNAGSAESTNTGGFADLSVSKQDQTPAGMDFTTPDITSMPGSFKSDTMTSADMVGEPKQYGFKEDYSDKGKGVAQDEVDKGDKVNNAKKKGNWWKNMTGVEKAETILAVGNRLLEPFEKKRMKKREEQLDEALFNPMNWGSAMPSTKGDWDQFGNFRPDSTVPTQFTGLAAYGGQLPMAQSGLEIKMKAGLGFNANQLSWPVMAGEFSQPDVEVRNTLGPVDRDDANLEAEVGETAVTNLTGDGIPEQYKIGGKRHYDGGTPLNLPDNSFIFSRDKTMKIKDKEVLAQFGITSVPKGGMTPADVAKRYDLNKYKKVLLDANSDELARDTAQSNIENANLKLGKLALIQESMKAFPDGIPMISMPYLESVSITPDMLPVNPQQELNEEEQPDADNQARYGTNVVAQFNTKRGGGRILPKHQTYGQVLPKQDEGFDYYITNSDYINIPNDNTESIIWDRDSQGNLVPVRVERDWDYPEYVDETPISRNWNMPEEYRSYLLRGTQKGFPTIYPATPIYAGPVGTNALGVPQYNTRILPAEGEGKYDYKRREFRDVADVIVNAGELNPVDIVGKKKQLTPVEQALKETPDIQYWGLEGTDFVDPSKQEYAIGMPFLAVMNYNKADLINQRKNFYNPMTAKIENADVNKNGKIDKDEWERIQTSIADYKDKKLDSIDIDSTRTGFGQLFSMFRTDVTGFSKGDEFDDIKDILSNKVSDFQDRYTTLLDMDYNKDLIRKTQNDLATYEKQLADHLKKGTNEIRLTDPNYYIKQLQYENRIKYLKEYIDKANKSIKNEENAFNKIVGSPSPHGGGKIIYIGGSPTRIPEFTTAYENELKQLTKDQAPAGAAYIDEDLNNRDTSAVVIDTTAVAPKKPDVPAAPAKQEPAPAAAPVQRVARTQQTVSPEQKARQQIGPDWDSWSKEQKDEYLKLNLRRGGQSLPMHQTPPGQTRTGAFTLGYEDMPGYSVVGPDWRLNTPAIGQQQPSADPDKYYVTSSGIIWPKSRKDNEPQIDWFKTYRGASDDVWKQYDKDKGFEKWKEDLAKAKGRQSKASEFWVKNIVNPYTTGITGKPYVDIGLTGAYVPGTEWSTPPTYTQISEEKTLEPCSPCNGIVPERVNGKCPECPPGDIPVKDTIEEKSYAGKTPFWTQDIINTGAAFRNLAEIKKYLPWQAKAPFYAAEPTFESPERALAANFEGLAQGVEGLSNFADPQAFAGSFSGMAGKAGANAANIIADVWNRNVQTDNQFEMANKQAYNAYMQNQADRATNMFDKTTIANQQYDNARREARDQMRQQFVNAWTNRGMTDTLNRMYSDQYRIDPRTSTTYFTEGRKFEPKLPTVNEMPENVKNIYNSLNKLGTAEGYQKAAKVYFDWLESEGYSGGKNKAKTNRNATADQMLMNMYAAMAGNWNR